MKFILSKIITIEVMLLILFFALNLFGLSLGIFNTIIYTSLKYLTPIAIICFIPYLILSVLDSNLIKMIISIIIGSLIVCYIYINYIA